MMVKHEILRNIGNWYHLYYGYTGKKEVVNMDQVYCGKMNGLQIDREVLS